MVCGLFYGSDFNAVNRLLCDGCGSDDVERATAYKQVLSLFIAQRRPSFYLVTNREALESLANSYLRMLAKAGIITTALRDSALHVKLRFREGPPELPAVSFVGRKAANAIRRQLSGLLDVPRLYELDRLDLTVKSTLNGATQDEVSRLLLRLRDPKYVEAAGLRGFRLLDHGDPSRVIYSFTLYEHVGNANLLRIQTDNFDQPFDINEGVKIELGSTAKLRTLVTYLEIIAGLHERYAGLPPEKLRAIHVDRGDRLTQWALDYLSTSRDSSLPTMLDAAMERRYSASPGEAFFTGGGQHTFHNFEKSDDSKILSVRDGLRNSVNLVFIRLMRDIVRYYMYHVPGSTARILADVEDPARQVYLARFADQEGRVFLNHFYNKYREKEPQEQMELLLQSVRPAPKRLAAVYRFVEPQAGVGEFSAFLQSRIPSLSLSEQEIQKLYEAYGPASWDLQDRGYIARLHPLELWLVAYLRLHPKADESEVIRASANERQEVYRWLFKTHRKNAQDIRIRSLLEVEAFLEIHRVWKRLGYPFDSLVPSYATAIGSSADRPASLAELVGIILNHGIRYPVVRIDELQFASGTPYETLLRRKEFSGQRVLSAEIATVVRRALIDVAERGSAQRIRGSISAKRRDRHCCGWQNRNRRQPARHLWTKWTTDRIPRREPRCGVRVFYWRSLFRHHHGLRAGAGGCRLWLYEFFARSNSENHGAHAEAHDREGGECQFSGQIRSARSDQTRGGKRGYPPIGISQKALKEENKNRSISAINVLYLDHPKCLDLIFIYLSCQMTSIGNVGS